MSDYLRKHPQQQYDYSPPRYNPYPPRYNPYPPRHQQYDYDNGYRRDDDYDRNAPY